MLAYRVTFDIESLTGMVRLTVTHDDLDAGSDMERAIANGWLRVVSSLKSLLETRTRAADLARS